MPGNSRPSTCNGYTVQLFLHIVLWQNLDSKQCLRMHKHNLPEDCSPSPKVVSLFQCTNHRFYKNKKLITYPCYLTFNISGFS